jgi:hypothetical protein
MRKGQGTGHRSFADNFSSSLVSFEDLAIRETNCDVFLISNFCRVLNVVCFLLRNTLASEFYMLMFRNTLFHFNRTMKAERGHAAGGAVG